MKTIYFIRHAQSLANAGGISLPERDIPLSDLGKQQAAELVFRLPEKTKDNHVPHF
ncbi:histidine phosphatase family protein [Wielerella bovis]|uniref:histidine phosphatase family protein n=1 Tax=Wielerella bovis TaxID=2917790 RepID=UPI00201A1A1A|nr:phosphoglycerate mutase family protein [Wielerella bovis]MCG7656426.1 histidine phosphatase family protein [Wielerella bovis]MCG7658651.1 histidine phosphatase family protein [Wielerella bovis]